MQDIPWRFYPTVAQHPITYAFVESLAKRQKRPKTVDAYARNLEDLLRAFERLGVRDVVEARPDHLEAYIDDLATRECVGRQPRAGSTKGLRLSLNTIQQRIVTARLFYDFCLTRGYRQHPLNPLPRGNPGYGDTPPERGVVPRQERLPWIPSDGVWEQLIRYVMDAESLRNQLLILLAYDGAFRREEVISLRLDDFDWPARLITIRSETTKSGRQRTVTFSPVTGRLLQRYLWNERAHILATFEGDKNGPVFLSESNRNAGQPITLGTFNDVIERIRTVLALPQLTPHTLRHLRCTVLKRCGVDLQDIAWYAGHQSIATTQLYIHLAPAELNQRIRAATASFDARMEQLIGQVMPHE